MKLLVERTTRVKVERGFETNTSTIVKFRLKRLVVTSTSARRAECTRACSRGPLYDDLTTSEQRRADFARATSRSEQDDYGTMAASPKTRKSWLQALAVVTICRYDVPVFFFPFLKDSFIIFPDTA